MKVLVTGGAGYIGSFMAKALIKSGNDVAIIDSLELGHEYAIDKNAVFYKGNLLDKEFVSKVFSQNKFDAVIHFAAYALAGESMEEPHKYFENNTLGGLNLLDSMKGKVPYFVFSSTCAVYGTPQSIPVTEESEKNPESVYGESKLMFENVLSWFDKLHGIKFLNLRYFNAAGASLGGDLGEDHDPETHIIPNAIKSILNLKPFRLYGTNYPTEDGTCVRDYIHVLDLIEGHMQGLDKLKSTNTSDSFNLGTGKGHSNRQVLDLVEKVSGKKINIVNDNPRPGDPPVIFADSSKAKRELGFAPKYSDLETIVKTAWLWHSRHKT